MASAAFLSTPTHGPWYHRSHTSHPIINLDVAAMSLPVQKAQASVAPPSAPPLSASFIASSGGAAASCCNSWSSVASEPRFTSMAEAFVTHLSMSFTISATLASSGTATSSAAASTASARMVSTDGRPASAPPASPVAELAASPSPSLDLGSGMRSAARARLPHEVAAAIR
eukprot:scaffold869_cov105-Isochrysis_galbana.AAC.18